ncbi:MAG TPA: ABC transporter ATP-binding protein [Acidimicrobiales bacterium]|nr:ABC transporter ATP-binding protein [Acidimicrobiales bacterium]
MAETATGQAAPQIELATVTKRFGSTTALDSLSLSAVSGEFLVLLGPSGCGKSTVLRLVAGLEEPTSGSISIGGRDVGGVAAKDRDVAMVFQSYALYPHMTVRRNIEFPLRARRSDAAGRAAAVQEVAESLRIVELLDRKPAQLSGGQRQRVALARAMVRRPKAFLMDEPLSNLDAQLRTDTRAELVDLHRRLGTTFVYVTHDQVEAMTMGSRIAVMDRGVLQQVGSPAEVHDMPANTFVAGFIGSPPMNLLPGVASADGEGQALAISGVDRAVVIASEPGPRAAGAVLVGFRPEAVRLSDAAALRGVVESVELLGHESHVSCHTAAGDRVVARLPSGAVLPSVGEGVGIGVDGRVHLFESSGQRLTGGVSGGTNR